MLLSLAYLAFSAVLQKMILIPGGAAQPRGRDARFRRLLSIDVEKAGVSQTGSGSRRASRVRRER
jgi:hypothetical protein